MPRRLAVVAAAPTQAPPTLHATESTATASIAAALVAAAGAAGVRAPHPYDDAAAGRLPRRAA